MQHEAGAFPIVDGVPREAPVPELQAPDDSTKVRATYSRPYVMHASLAPSAAAALWDADRLTIWSHSQGIELLGPTVAKVLGIAAQQVTVVHTQGAGAYGHNGADDVALDAALCARAVPGRPVLLKWTRQQEHQWEPYGPAMRIDLEAHVDGSGNVQTWSHDVWSFTHVGRPMPFHEGSELVAAWHLEKPLPRVPPAPRLGPEVGIHRNAWPLYRFPQTRVVKRFVKDSPLRTSSLRGLGAHANVFAIESFMDELAIAAGADPIEFRLRHTDDARARDVIERVAAMAKRSDGARRRRSRADAAWLRPLQEPAVLCSGDRRSGRRPRVGRHRREPRVDRSGRRPRGRSGRHREPARRRRGAVAELDAEGSGERSIATA